MRTGHITLLDIARACKCSVSTVSIVLSETPLSRKVAAKTRQRICSVASQLGYHPDASARSLRSRRSKTIGVLAYDLSDPYCVPIVRGIQAGLQPAGFLPLLMDARSQRPLFDSYLQMILEHRAEGVIVIASWILDDSNLLADIRKNHVPIVILSRDLTGRGVSSIMVDNEAGGALALGHLHGLGHRHIAVIRGPGQLPDSELRWAGVQKAARKLGLRLDGRLVTQLPGLVDAASSFNEGLASARHLLAAKGTFSAVLAFDDLTALGVVRGLAEAGLRVPQHCSVIGFDDVLPAAVSTPAITTIRQPLDEMGRTAAEWMLASIGTREHGPPGHPRLLQAQPELVVRTSTARLERNSATMAELAGGVKRRRPTGGG